MESKTWVALAALLVALSGCASNTPGADPDHQDADMHHDEGNMTAAPAINNTAPVATLEASTLNGTAPLNVTLTLNGTDAEDTNLTWTLTFGNQTLNGTTLPAMVNLTLIAGNHTITHTVSDGNLTGNATVRIVVEAAEEIVEEAGDGLCHRSATVLAGEIYLVSEAGDWLFLEDNGVPGLQVENNHIIGDPLWVNDIWADCVGGDQMLN